MSIHFGFEPDPVRARELDRRMYRELASSLDHVLERSRDTVALDEDGLSRLVADLGRGVRYEPSAFGWYYRLVEALLEGDTDAARRWSSHLVSARSLAEDAGREQVVKPLAGPGTSPRDALYHQLMNGDPALEIGIHPPSDEVARAFESRFREGMELMEGAIPELAGEVRAIVHEVVPLVGDPSKEMQFDGGSHFQLWGALFLNADFHPTPHAIVEVVAHESAHSLLFSFCTEEPLVYNDDDELYPSPLRRDPRPMDGIYHATYVSARMHWAMSRLLETDLLDGKAREEAIEARDADATNFEKGLEVIDEHGRLSPVGEGLLAGAREYLAAARR